MRRPAEKSQKMLVSGLLGWVLAVSLFYPRAFKLLGVPEFYALSGMLVVAALIVIGRSKPTVALLAIAGLCLFFALRFGIMLFSEPATAQPTEATTTNLGEVGTIAVLGLIAGWLGAAGGTPARLIRTPFLAVAIISAVLAVVESSTGFRFFPSEAQIGYDGRAFVGQQHPITLGLFIGVAIALLYGTRARVRVPLAAILLGGTIATGSEGPIAIAVILTLAVLLPGPARAIAGRTKFITFASIVAIGVVVWLSFFHWTTHLYDASVDQYSAGYRTALYAVLPEILARNPLGFGPNGMPADTYYIYSTYRGVRDMSLSIDSEPVYLATQLGIVGIAIFLAVYFTAVAALRRSLVPALMLVAVMLGGVLVALHAWLSVTALVTGLLGICIHSLVAGRAAPAVTTSPDRRTAPRSRRRAFAA